MSTKAPISFRPAVGSDVDFLRALRYTTMREVVQRHREWRDGEQDQRVMTHFNAARIIIRDGRKIGMLKVVREADHVYLIQIQLLPEFQGHGIGTSVITALQEECGSLDLPIILHAYLSNRAIGLYSRLGFAITDHSECSCMMRWQQRKEEPNQSLQPTGLQARG